MIKKTCSFCNKNIIVENHHQWMAHRSNCKFRPNQCERYKKIADKLKIKRILLKKKCEKCGIEFEQTIKENGKGYIKRFCSRSCANGRPHTEEWNKHISENVKSDKWKTNYEKYLINKFHITYKFEEEKKYYCIICGIQLFNFTGKYCDMCRKKHIRQICQTKKHRQKMSTVTKNAYKNGKSVYGGTTKWIECNTTNGKIKVQGSYEVRMVKILEYWKKINKIYDWKYPGDRFKYIGIDNNEHTYIVDFKVFNNEHDFYYIEIKGWEKENDKYKWNDVKKLGYRLDILFENDIQQLEKEIDDMAILGE